ncbi:acetate--CoA ligase family protein [Salinimicrobium sp. TH3]|uniref:acetate--CoA ligase family protein n=1 Tax=Salinimicrobium sp. TH3 TaxID=2997342 RepID=UPI00227321BA|nr:acetate--CoA ligase family protein [Salinimicrobium sp. TH3]MCY2687374.1 acetate--CoA ligase family protein [Salinimicrobium sp. TH3]
MLHPKLIHPKSIVVVGGSDNIHSPGGRVLKNLLDHQFEGNLFVVNPKQDVVQGVRSYNDINDLPEVDLAIIAIAAKYVVEAVKVLTQKKNTKGFIIFSAGFSEKDEAGAKLEREIVGLINEAGGSLLGPNNIGLINKHYTGVFTTPIPKLDENGVDFISGSGATAVFIIEAAKSMGLTFSSLYTVGNSAQIGVEEILEYLDRSFDKETSSRVKLLYIESIKNPLKFLEHTASLIGKGCKIAAIKAGSSEEGNRAASSHTGAIANSDVFVDTLFKKAGILRCYGRNELITVAGILQQKESEGKNIAIITHAGGPAVMLTDVLSKNGLKIPHLEGKESKALLDKLFDGSTVSNPIDFLATGNAGQLDAIIEYCENSTQIDAITVIFGSPGLTAVDDVYAVLDKKINTSKKPIYAVLPSVVNVKNEIREFIKKGNIAFHDEVLFGQALSKVYNQTPVRKKTKNPVLQFSTKIRKLINALPDGYLPTEVAISLLETAGVKFAVPLQARNQAELNNISNSVTYPVVLKVEGPLHKSDVGGVILNVSNEVELHDNFHKLMQIEGATSVMIQPMIKGMELFIGAKKETNYPHVILCGLGGIFVEVLKDISAAMTPVSDEEALQMITDLKAAPILKGIRGQAGINIKLFADTIVKISDLLTLVPEIAELDLNPLMATQNDLTAVDVRIRLERSVKKLQPNQINEIA